MLEPVVSVVGVLPHHIPGQRDVSLLTLQLQPGLLRGLPANIDVVKADMTVNIKYLRNSPWKQEQSFMNSDLNAKK